MGVVVGADGVCVCGGGWGVGGAFLEGLSSYYVEVCVCIHGLMCGFIFPSAEVN